MQPYEWWLLMPTALFILALLWYIPLKILFTAEKAKRDHAFCKGGNALELNTVRYQTLRVLHTQHKTFVALYTVACVALVCMLAGVLWMFSDAKLPSSGGTIQRSSNHTPTISVNNVGPIYPRIDNSLPSFDSILTADARYHAPGSIKESQRTKSYQQAGGAPLYQIPSSYMIAWVIAILSLIISITTATITRLKKLTPLHIISMVSTASAVTVMGGFLYKRKIQPQGLIWIGLITVLLVFLAILPATLKKLYREYGVYEREYLQKCNQDLKKKMPWRVRDTIVQNVMFVHPEMTQEDASSFTDKLADPMAYLSVEKYAHLNQLFSAIDRKEFGSLYEKLRQPGYREPMRLNPQQIDAMKFTRKQLMGQIMYLAVATAYLLAIAYVFMQNQVIYFFLTILALLFALWYIGTIYNNTVE